MNIDVGTNENVCADVGMNVDMATNEDVSVDIDANKDEDTDVDMDEDMGVAASVIRPWIQIWIQRRMSLWRSPTCAHGF